MKKTIICLVAAVMTLCATTGAKAQKVGFGVKGGVNLSTWTSDNSKFRVGLHVGGFANIKFNKMFAIQPELMYSMEGGKYTAEQSVAGYYVNFKYTTTAHKLIVPVMFQITPIRELTLEAGPQFGFNLSLKGHYNVDTNFPGAEHLEPYQDGDVDYNSDSYNTFELGLALGARFNIAKNMSVGARYVYGLTPLFDEVKVGGVVESEATHTHNVMISFSYGF